MEKQPKLDYSDIKFKDNGKLKLIIVRLLKKPSDHNANRGGKEGLSADLSHKKSMITFGIPVR